MTAADEAYDRLHGVDGHIQSVTQHGWACPDCAWTHDAHPTYGWSARDDRAVEVHQATLCPWRKIEPCRLGYEEYDGARYCHEHSGFLEAGVRSRRCDRASGDRGGAVTS